MLAQAQARPLPGPMRKRGVPAGALPTEATSPLLRASMQAASFDPYKLTALAAFPELNQGDAALTVVGSGAIANNAGGVLVFNLTTDQQRIEARIWPSDSLRVTPGTEIAPAGLVDKQVLPFLRLELTRTDKDPSAQLFLHTTEQPEGAIVPVDNHPAAAMTGGAVPHSRTYWLSFDRMNRRIKYGRGYFMERTTENVWTLPKPDEEEGKAPSDGQLGQLDKLFGFGVKMACLLVDKAVQQDGTVHDGVASTAATIAFHPLPLVVDRPAKVLDSSLVTLADMDSAEFLFSADLPPACRVLYENVAGKGEGTLRFALLVPDSFYGNAKPGWSQLLLAGAKVVLDDQLAAAISYSIKTPGKALHEKLKTKDPEFGYLRVVLGPELGDGPGVPYVLEIWPGASRSPIHNHGNVCAVIKLLHGSIEVDIHNKLEASGAAQKDPSIHHVKELEEASPKPLKTVSLAKGDVTWMDSNWYQCHRLRNPNSDRGQFCATIQCYKYDDRDSVKWPGFDYVQGDNDGIFLFKPDADFTYSEMRKQVLAEMADDQADSKADGKEGQ